MSVGQFFRRVGPRANFPYNLFFETNIDSSLLSGNGTYGTMLAHKAIAGESLPRILIKIKGEIVLIKKYFACFLSLLILTGLLTPLSVHAQSDSVEKVRSKVQNLATNRDKQIEVKLHDKTKIKGYIVSVDSDSFTIADSSTATAQKVLYSDVNEVKKVSNGFSAKTWLILGGVAAGTVATWLIVKPAVCDGGAQTRGIC